jgi:hypothetical protein
MRNAKISRSCSRSMKWSNHPSGNLGVTLSGRSYAEMPRFGRSLTLPGVSISRSSQMVLIFAPFLSVCQSQRYLSSNRAHAASETLGTPVESSHPMMFDLILDVRKTVFATFLTIASHLSQDRFNRPAGTGLFSSGSQALRAWLRSGYPSGTKYT